MKNRGVYLARHIAWSIKPFFLWGLDCIWSKQQTRRTGTPTLWLEDYGDEMKSPALSAGAREKMKFDDYTRVKRWHSKSVVEIIWLGVQKETSRPFVVEIGASVERDVLTIKWAHFVVKPQWRVLNRSPGPHSYVRIILFQALGRESALMKAHWKLLSDSCCLWDLSAALQQSSWPCHYCKPEALFALGSITLQDGFSWNVHGRNKAQWSYFHVWEWE